MTGTTEIDEIQDINTKVPDFDLLIMGRVILSQSTAGTFFEGEEVQQGDTFSGTIVNWNTGTNRLTIFGASGSPETTSGVTGVSSGAYALFSATGPASIAAVGVTANLVDVDGFSDNETLEREGILIP